MNIVCIRFLIAYARHNFIIIKYLREVRVYAVVETRGLQMLLFYPYLFNFTLSNLL